ncbi:hypothetical protein [Streptomyces sp. NPDC127084]|uniref:hypothetical protein n=1 Tax=Streptomyces sp. NPDC127084 TaxID=3347133 RepID=UPI0036582D07
MTPRRSDDIDKAREDLQKELAEAKAKRDRIFEELDKAREAAEAEFWKTVDRKLTDAYHGARTDAVKTLGFTRDHILKKTKQYH